MSLASEALLSVEGLMLLWFNPYLGGCTYLTAVLILKIVHALKAVRYKKDLMRGLVLNLLQGV